MMADSIARVSGSARIFPNGSRVAPVMPESPTRKTNFFQRSASTVSVIEMSTPACLAASAKAASFLSGLPSTRPQRIWAKSLVWLTVPGPDITLAIYAMPPTTLSWPRIGCRRSTESTPFCSVITRVSGPTIGRMSSPAFSVSHSLTANSTISTGATDLGSSVAVTLGNVRSPLVLSIFSPRSRSAARLAPRAKKTTSCPAAASRPPKYPPTAPAAITPMRMSAPRSYRPARAAPLGTKGRAS